MYVAKITTFSSIDSNAGVGNVTRELVQSGSIAVYSELKDIVYNALRDKAKKVQGVARCYGILSDGTTTLSVFLAEWKPAVDNDIGHFIFNKMDTALSNLHG